MLTAVQCVLTSWKQQKSKQLQLDSCSLEQHHCQRVYFGHSKHTTINLGPVNPWDELGGQKGARSKVFLVPGPVFGTGAGSGQNHRRKRGATLRRKAKWERPQSRLVG